MSTNIYNRLTSGNSFCHHINISTQAPVFEYTYNGTYYREQTTQNISHKRLNKGMTQGKMYSIYIDPKHPAVFILAKKIKIGTIVAIILGLFIFTNYRQTCTRQTSYARTTRKGVKE